MFEDSRQNINIDLGWSIRLFSLASTPACVRSRLKNMLTQGGQILFCWAGEPLETAWPASDIAGAVFRRRPRAVRLARPVSHLLGPTERKPGGCQAPPRTNASFFGRGFPMRCVEVLPLLDVENAGGVRGDLRRPPGSCRLPRFLQTVGLPSGSNVEDFRRATRAVV